MNFGGRHVEIRDYRSDCTLRLHSLRNSPVAALLPAPLQAKFIMIPMGLGVAWMGYALLAERREKSAEALSEQRVTNPEVSDAA